MPITLRDALELEIFSHAEAEVLAGASCLDRKIRWVHSSEMADIAHFLIGGELLLTTGLGIGGDEGLQRTYMRDLAAVQVAGLVLQLGRSFTQVPPSMIRDAESYGFPLVALNRKTRFVEITEQLHSAIINRQYDLLSKAEKIARDFTELVLHGAGTQRILRRLTEIVENPVVLEDPAHQVVEFAAYAETDDQVLRAWESHSRKGHSSVERGTVVLDPGDPPCAWIPIASGEGTWGNLHVLALDTSLDEMDLLAVDRGAAAIGLSLLTERNVSALARRTRSALLLDLIGGRYGATSDVLRRAKLSGVDLGEKRLAPLLVEIRDFADYGDRHALTDYARQEVLNSVLEDLVAAVAKVRGVTLSAVNGNRVMSLIGLPREASMETALEALGNEICTRIRRRLGDAVPIVGITGETSLESLSTTFDEAAEALRYGLRVGREPGTYRFGNLGFRGLLLRLSEGPELGRFVETQLGPLLDHDADSKLDLLGTLRAYLNAGGNKTAAAHALHIERRSLYYRLERVQDVLNREIDDPTIRTRLMVALEGLDVIQSRGKYMSLSEG